MFKTHRAEKTIIITIIILVIVAIYSGITLSKYTSSFNKTSNLSIAKWNVYCNNVKLGANPVSVTPNFTITSSNDVAQGKLAPGSAGKLEFVFDPKDTEVPLMYIIDFNTSEAEALNNNGFSFSNPTYKIGASRNSLSNLYY